MRVDVNNVEPRHYDRGDVRVIKNFLPRTFFLHLRDLVMGGDFPWYYNKSTLTNMDDGYFMFVHALMWNSEVVSPLYNEFQQMLPYVKEALDYKKLTRLKLNCYPNQNKKILHPLHIDAYEHNTKDYVIGVLHFNTCNGETIVNDEKIKSEENQMLLFDNIPHQSAVQTDTRTRVILNFNFKI
jgi:hypothetical protein|tara:strand:+ start:172 stop:720 length:549 start_codon:yes stop_codon:yes gene_type:complete